MLQKRLYTKLQTNYKKTKKPHWAEMRLYIKLEDNCKTQVVPTRNVTKLHRKYTQNAIIIQR